MEILVWNGESRIGFLNSTSSPIRTWLPIVPVFPFAYLLTFPPIGTRATCFRERVVLRTQQIHKHRTSVLTLIFTFFAFYHLTIKWKLRLGTSSKINRILLFCILINVYQNASLQNLRIFCVCVHKLLINCTSTLYVLLKAISVVAGNLSKEATLQ